MRSQILQNMEKAVLTNDLRIQEGLLNYVVVGGGPTGVELAGSIAELKRHVFPKDYPELDLRRMNIFLVEGSNKLLGAMSEKSSGWALKYLQEMGVTVVLNAVVQSYDGETVYLKNGSTIRTKTLIWAAGVKGNVVPGLNEECLFKGSRIVVDAFNRAKCYENIYAIGDVAAMLSEGNPQGHPMLAPVAKQQGETLARNLNAKLRGRPMKPFKYADKGSMATVGRNKAVADLPGGFFLKGFPAWAAWMLVHVLFLIGFRSKLIVMANWIWSYLTYDKGTRLIIRPYVQPNNPAVEEPLPKEVAAHTPGAEQAAASSAR
jgi:NADH dehydrogenase